MPNYRFQVKSAGGQIQVGTLSAQSADNAAQILRKQGARVLSLSQTDDRLTASLYDRLKALNASKPSQKHLLDFTTQLSVMMRAGINLRSALDGIADQTTHAGFKKILLQIKEDVEAGKQFSEAIARHQKLFGPLYFNMVQAAEMAGSFADALDRIAGYIAQQMETKKMVIGASIYPAIIGLLATAVTIFLLTFVLPKFYGIFEGKEDVLPWATVFLMGLSRGMIAHWPFILGGIGVVLISFYAFLRTEVGGFWLDKTKISIPVVKNMFRSLYLSRGLQTMGQLINAGVPMLDTLAITGEISGNRLYKRVWQGVYAAVKQGRKIAQPLQKDRMLPKSVCQMIAAGEESGKLGEVLDQIAVYYHKVLKDQIKAVTGLIEPIMIIIMGSVVGFIAMAVILPIFKMSQLVG